MTPEETELRAGEYVLGTLSSEERAETAAALTSDRALAEAVRRWEARLDGLAALVPPETPPAGVWTALAAALDAEGVGSRAAGSAEIIQLRRRMATWRRATIGTGALAACLAAALIAGPFLRAPTPPPAGQRYVAVVNRGGEMPPLLVNVDTGEGRVSVLSVAAEAPPERSYELWYIREGDQPRSMGVIDNVGGRIDMPTDKIEGFAPQQASFAVTLEPEGGSPTGVATGPIVYSGQLVPAGD